MSARTCVSKQTTPALFVPSFTIVKIWFQSVQLVLTFFVSKPFNFQVRLDLHFSRLQLIEQYLIKDYSQVLNPSTKAYDALYKLISRIIADLSEI